MLVSISCLLRQVGSRALQQCAARLYTAPPCFEDRTFTFTLHVATQVSQGLYASQYWACHSDACVTEDTSPGQAQAAIPSKEALAGNPLVQHVCMPSSRATSPNPWLQATGLLQRLKRTESERKQHDTTSVSTDTHGQVAGTIMQEYLDTKVCLQPACKVCLAPLRVHTTHPSHSKCVCSASRRNPASGCRRQSDPAAQPLGHAAVGLSAKLPSCSASLHTQSSRQPSGQHCCLIKGSECCGRAGG